MSDIITLSSDDEYEPASKKVKASNDSPVLKELLLNFSNGRPAVELIPDLPVINSSITLTAISNSSTQQKSVDLTSFHEDTIEVSLVTSKSDDCLVISDDEVDQSDPEASCNDVRNNKSDRCKETLLVDSSSPNLDIAEISESDTAEDKEDSTNILSETTEAVSDIESTKESSEPGCSVDTEHSELPLYMTEFLNACVKSLENTQYKARVVEKFPKMKKNFFSNSSIQTDVNFKKTVERCTAKAKISPIEAIQAFRDVHSYILDVVKGSFIEIPEENVRKVKKLEKFINKITRKIKKLDEAEVDFENDSNSVYMQHDRYTRRLKKVYDKYCQLIGRSSCVDKIPPFIKSQYTEINRAITRSCKHNKFPSYTDIERVVRKCVKKHQLGLSETEIKSESRVCFTELGETLQLKRKKDLYMTHRQLLMADEGDPASKDPALAEVLTKSAKQGKEKLQEVLAKYASMQDKNEKDNVAEQPVSEDSDDSNYKSSSSGEDD